MFKLTRSVPIILAAFILIGGVSAANGQRITEILSRMDKHNQALSSLQADVTMAKYNSQLKLTDVTKGKTIYLPRKGKDPLVRIDWVDPREESLAVVGKEYIIYRPRLKQYIKGKTNQAKGNAKSNSALAFMNMSRAELRKNYDIQYLNSGTLSDGTKTDHLRLTPKNAGDYKFAEVWVDANGMPVQTKVVEKNDDTTTVLLTNIVKNKTINASSFRIVPAKDAQRIDG